MTDRAVEVLSRAECLELLSHAAIGRVGVSIDALPVILPVHFALFGDSVLFRTVPGTKFDAAAVGAVLAFQADSYEPESPTAWSVLLQGIASEVTHPEEGRMASSTWKDVNGNLWLFGGEGVDSAGTVGGLNDLWAFNPSGNQWAWMGGSNTVGSD